MAQRSIRLPELLFEEIVREAHERGYASTSAFIRAAIQNELHRVGIWRRLNFLDYKWHRKLPLIGLGSV